MGAEAMSCEEVEEQSGKYLAQDSFSSDSLGCTVLYKRQRMSVHHRI